MIKKSQICLLKGDIEKAGIYSDVARDISTELMDNKGILHSRLQSLRVSAKTKKNMAIDEIISLLDEYGDDYSRAVLYSELYNYDADEEYLKKSICLYEKLYDRTRAFSIGKKIKELKYILDSLDSANPLSKILHNRSIERQIKKDS